MNREIKNPLDFLYCFMGWVTLHTGGMSRSSVNFVRSNTVLMGTCLVLSPASYLAYRGSGDWWLILLSLFSLFVFVLLVIGSLLGHTVFRRKKATVPQVAPLTNFDGSILFNGKMVFREKTSRRLLGDAAHIVTLEDGSLGFAALVGSATTMYGLVLSQEQAVWYSVPTPGTLKVVEGVYYRGFQGFPALRLSYTEQLGHKRKKRTAIIGFTSESARESGRKWLTDKVNPIVEQ